MNRTERVALGVPSLIPSIVLVAALALSSACSSGSRTSAAPTGGASPAKLNVVATTVQVTALTKEVGGDLIDLHGVIPAGADPHSFEPVASDLAAIEGARLILRHGIGLDDWLDGTLSAGSRAQVVRVTDGVTLRKGEEGGEQVDDPHVWHDPANAQLMISNIASALDGVDPAHRPEYDAAAAAYNAKLDATKSQVQALIDEIPQQNRKLVTDHDALGYFANAFGLEVIGAVIPSVSTDADASAKQTAELLDTIKRENVKAIFAEASVNSQLSTTLAQDAGVKIVDDLFGDSLGEQGTGTDTVDGMLLYNARKIADALK